MLIFNQKLTTYIFGDMCWKLRPMGEK